MITLQGTASGIVARGADTRDFDFSLSSVARDRVVSGSTTGETTLQDSVYDVFTPAVVAHEAVVYAADQFRPITLTSLDTGIATLSDGAVTRVSDGTARIIADCETYRKRIDIAVSETGGETVNVFARFAAGSFAAHASDAVDDLLPGEMDAFTVRDHAGNAYTRNPACWCPPLTGVVAGKTISPSRLGVTAITRDAAIGCNHAPLSASTVLRFVTADGTVVERGISGQAQAGTADLRVYALDSDLPVSVEHYSIPPATFGDYIPGVANGIPAACPDQQGRVTVAELRSITGSFQQSAETVRAAHWAEKVDGDSGYPAILLGAERMLLTCWRSKAAGPPTWTHIADINAALTAAGSAHAVTVADLSAWPDWSGA